MADYSKRTHATQYYAGVTSGFMCDFVHVTGAAGNNTQIPAGSSVTLLSINVAPGSGNVMLKCGTDIVMAASIARDYKMGFYAYAPITIMLPDATADVTVYFAPPAKGQVAGQ